MKWPRVCALDLSLQATGVCWPTGDTVTVRPPWGAAEPEWRLRWLATELALLAARTSSQLVVLEGFSYGSHSSRMDQVHALGWDVRQVVYCDLGLPYVAVPPQLLKRYATGHGNADKAAMREARRAATGRDEPDDNRNDAWWLWALAEHAYGRPPAAVPADRATSAIEQIAWPQLAEGVGDG